jgi:hypothetical protein
LFGRQTIPPGGWIWYREADEQQASRARMLPE